MYDLRTSVASYFVLRKSHIGSYARKFFLSTAVVLATSASFAQDMHFSQFYNSPLTLNPALTGKMKEDFRFSLIHRRQWKQINSPYMTSAIAGDINFRVGEASKNQKVGTGILFMNDDLGDGIFKNQSIMLSGAFHKTNGTTKHHKVSLGIQSGFMRKNLTTAGLYFRDQIVNYQYDPATATGEPVLGNGFSYINVNAGGFWNFVFRPNVEFYGGISLYNINKPKERAFVNLTDPNTLKTRSVFTGGMNYKLSARMSILPTVLYMRQSGAVDLIAGSSVGYVMGNVTLIGGAYYRTIDALILIGGVKFKNYHAGLSYDATVSSLPDVKTAPNVDDDVRVGAFEISLIYTGFLKRPIPQNTTIPCRFF